MARAHGRRRVSAEPQGALAHACEAIALNRAQHRALYNPSLAVDSLAERLLALSGHGVPRPVIRALLRDVRTVLDLNTRERGAERRVTAALDALGSSELTVKALARALRPELRTLREDTDGTRFALAAIRLREVCEQQTPERLRSQALRHELGAGPHDQLVELLSVGAAR